MQTFLPYSDFIKSASVLDKKRCFKQVVEAKQILCTLRADNLPEDWQNTKAFQNQRWQNHPAVKMWKGYEEALKQYYNSFLMISLDKHKINTTMPYLDVIFSNVIYPWWLGKMKFHRAMRARLIEKDENFYKPIFDKEDVNFNEGKYLWPKTEATEFYMV